MTRLILIFLGGGLGSLCRYVCGLLIKVNNQFPAATLFVNLVASFIVGLLAGLALQKDLSDNQRAFLIIGFCGGFSTFSAFAWQNVDLILKSENLIALIYSMVSVVGCVLVCWLGLILIRSILA